VLTQKRLGGVIPIIRTNVLFMMGTLLEQFYASPKSY